MSTLESLRPSSRTTSKPTLFALLAFFNTDEDERFLSVLPERDQRIVRLVIEGYTYASIAREMGITKQRVSQVARRSVAMLDKARKQARRTAM